MSEFNPQNIIQGDDGRWYHDGIDVTDKPVWWKCPKCGESYQMSIAKRIAGEECPNCKKQDS